MSKKSLTRGRPRRDKSFVDNFDEATGVATVYEKPWPVYRRRNLKLIHGPGVGRRKRRAWQNKRNMFGRTIKITYTESCSAPVMDFMRGWVRNLHALTEEVTGEPARYGSSATN